MSIMHSQPDEVAPHPRNTRLTPQQVEAMRRDWMGGMRQVDIAAKYGVSQGSVSKRIGGSPVALAEEVRRLREGIAAYFLHGYGSQQARERALWNVINGEATPWSG